MANSGANTNGSQFFIVQAKDVVEEALTALRDARDNNEGEELGVTLTDGKYYTFSQLFPDSVLEHYKEVGGAAHLEYVFGRSLKAWMWWMPSRRQKQTKTISLWRILPSKALPLKIIMHNNRNIQGRLGNQTPFCMGKTRANLHFLLQIGVNHSII